MNAMLESPRKIQNQAKGTGVSAANDEARIFVEEHPLPDATYRLQFNRAFTFRDAANLVPYLASLGVTHCYASPYLKAGTGSMHGYDIQDHTALNPEIGTAEDYQAFVTRLREHGMRQILDVVPNHMGVSGEANAWWMDVLEHGPSSPYASFFDIDWMPLKRDLAHKVLLPVLGDQFGRVLEDQQLVLKHDDGTFRVHYYDHSFPVATQTIGLVLKHRLDELVQRLGNEQPHVLEYHSILTAISHLPARSETDPEKINELRREKEVIKRRIAELCRASDGVRSFIAENTRIFNGTRGDSQSFDLLEQLLEAQAYRLAYWRVAADEINYRRFFDINELAAICMENGDVLQKTHELIFQLLAQGSVHGLRIDHPDGLYDPAEYLRRLHAAHAARCPGGDPLYVVVEKILEPGERLPSDWPVNGTTGYEFLNALNGLFVDRTHAREFDRIYTLFTRDRRSFRDLVYQSKKLIMNVSMSSEISVLGHQLDRISEQNRWSRDFTLNGLTDALREIIACFPVYRTYITESAVSDRDRRYVETAVSRAKRKNPATSASIFDFVADTLLRPAGDGAARPTEAARRRFVGKFQQLTGPVMAKGVEDTACYVYNRLISLNEVGGDPEKFGVSVASFHQHNQDRLVHWPHSLLATSTHDTKRGEDVRARINALSEVPHEWRSHVFRWTRWNQRKKHMVDGELAPSRNDEYHLYQTLIGTWPFRPLAAYRRAQYVERIEQYMIKATREAKAHTSWISPNEAYEEAMRSFIGDLLCERPKNAFLADFEPFVRDIADCGIWNSLSQTLLKLTCPGVPDTYQGADLWDFRLVDPDNRQPIDYSVRQAILRSLQKRIASSGGDLSQLAADLVSNRQDGQVKLYVLLQSLGCRRRHPALFTSGDYIPLEASGAKRDHLCAFARKHGEALAVVVVPRMCARLTGFAAPPLGACWEDTAVRLPSSVAGVELRNALTGELVPHHESADGRAIRASELFDKFPVALLAPARPVGGG
jgi:(1->4)-alpha-D-glucan 1-alpha-D-glucosylmutase